MIAFKNCTHVYYSRSSFVKRKWMANALVLYVGASLGPSYVNSKVTGKKGLRLMIMSPSIMIT